MKIKSDHIKQLSLLNVIGQHERENIIILSLRTWSLDGLSCLQSLQLDLDVAAPKFFFFQIFFLLDKYGQANYQRCLSQRPTSVTAIIAIQSRHNIRLNHVNMKILYDCQSLFRPSSD